MPSKSIRNIFLNNHFDNWKHHLYIPACEKINETIFRHAIYKIIDVLSVA